WPHPGARGGSLILLAVVAIGVGAALLRWGRLLARGVFHVVVGQATLMIAAGVILSADDTAALGVASAFVFCAIDNLYFFARRAAVAHTTFFLAAVAGSLLWREIDLGVVGAFVLVQVTVVAVVSRLVQRAAHGTRDSLTGLPNRRGFDERLEETVSTAHRTGNDLSVALIDLDHFKDVNDSDGHAAGDVLLASLAATLRDHLPPGAVLSRHGGDEFAVLAPGLGLPAMIEAAAHLRAIAAPVGLSVGVAQLGNGEDVGTLVRRADAAMYEAKRAGRGRVHAAAGHEDVLLRDLRACLADGDIGVVLQPILVPGTATLVGVEALARWHHPERGAVPPCEFIPLAEANGLIAALDAAVTRRACAEATWLRQALGRDLLLTVNVSGRHLIDADFVSKLVTTLQTTGWRAGDLVVEVTESVMEAASCAAHITLEELRTLGVRVAIDDFGTGYSAFSQLDSLPADFLKLDAKFTSQITTSVRRRAVLGGLVRMSEELGLVLIAEGVETIEQEEVLLALGCHLAQGYLFHRPLPAAELLHALTGSGAAGFEIEPQHRPPHPALR
ncbi:MAG: putative bifunctional diguanylate cyclase/phosphodiesterase, partial [Janthinobacterium lividum]